MKSSLTKINLVWYLSSNVSQTNAKAGLRHLIYIGKYTKNQKFLQIWAFRSAKTMTKSIIRALKI